MARLRGAQYRWGKGNKGFAEVLLEAGQTLSKKGAQRLAYGIEEFLANTDWEWPRGRNNGSYKSGYHGGDADHPWYTGNLHDSIAGSLSDGTKVLAVRYMKPGALVAQTDDNGAIVDGAELAREYAQRASHTFGQGIRGLVARLIIAAPYTEKVNESDAHFDFVSPLEEDFVNEILSQLEDLPKISIRPKKR